MPAKTIGVRLGEKRARLGRVPSRASRDAETLPVADQTPGPATSSNVPSKLTRLDSWKGIATYLKRDVTTVRRWEKREGLPVHRHPHAQRDSVYAYAAEIDDWWENRRNAIVPNGAVNGDSPADGTDARSVPWAWALAATFFVTTVVLGALLLRRPATTGDEAVERQFSIFPPAGTSFRSVIVSPDGRHLAFTAAPSQDARGKTKLWVQSFDSREARVLPDTEDASLPFWSPASDALGFFAERHLWTIDLAGGRTRKLSAAPAGQGGTWNKDATIVFAPAERGALYRVSATGGSATAVTTLADGEQGHVRPAFLPDGRHFIYVAPLGGNRDEDPQVFVAELDGTSTRPILSARSAVLPSANGFLVYRSIRQLFARPFDLSALSVTGEPVALAAAVTHFSLSSNAVLTYRPPQSSATRLVWRDRAGGSSPWMNTPADYYEPTLAPDETRLAYDVFEPKPSERFGYGPARVRSNIFVVDRATGVSRQITSTLTGAWAPVWSPDGKSIVFSVHRGEDALDLFQKDTIDPDAVEVPLTTIGSRPAATSWSADGRFIVYSTFDPTTSGDLWLLPMVGDRTPIPLLQSEFTDVQGQISPDGRWLAYTSNESGSLEVWVTTFPRATARWQISSGGAGDPRWRSDGKELFFIAEDRLLMAVPIKGGTTFTHGSPVSLFDTGVPPHWYQSRNLYDVSRDGRFLFMSPVEDDRSSPVTVVLNWAARLKK
jgi:eukaryotic-like serine/threonine-protein kinase